jgi:hypothetical protein
MATQTPSDLGSMFVQLMQRQQANQQFNTGLGMLAAGFAQPRDREAMIGAMSGQSGPDAGSLMGNLMKLQQYNQQQARYADLVNNSDNYAKAFNMDPAMFKAAITAAGPQGAGDILGKIAEGQMGLTGNLTDKEYQQARRQWGTTPDSQDAQGKPLPQPTWLNTEAGFQAHQLTVEAQGKDVREAAQALPGYNVSLGDMSKRIADVQAQAPVIKGILGDPKKQIAAQTLLAAEPGSWSGILAQNSGVLNDAELKAIGDLK